MIVKDAANIEILHGNKHQIKCNIVYNTKKIIIIITLITLFIITLYYKSN